MINKTQSKVICGNEIEPREIEWLWYPYIPIGKLTTIQGDPGEVHGVQLRSGQRDTGVSADKMPAIPVSYGAKVVGG